MGKVIVVVVETLMWHLVLVWLAAGPRQSARQVTPPHHVRYLRRPHKHHKYRAITRLGIFDIATINSGGESGGVGVCW